MRITAFLFGGNRERLFGAKPTHWVSYIQNGNVVPIEDDQAVNIFDPAKQIEL